MKLLLLMYSGPTPQRISALLEVHQAPGYTEFENGRGSGPSGRLAGTRAWPGSATVFLSVVPDDRVAPLRTALAAYREQAAEGEHLHVATVPMEDYF